MFELNVLLQGYTRIDFDKKKIRKVMRKMGRDVQREARRLVARKAISSAGAYPGKQTGRLQRSLKSRVSKSGFLVRIAPQKSSEMKDFYPAFLYYGVTGKARRKDQKAQTQTGRWRIAPRANFMQEALDQRRAVVRAELRDVLRDALVPRK
ncbi:MAG: HK97 gp10 family phage protein [Ottowia sp.]|nr:HK97 gp10 family phage protein [Ottowia sp.]